jgi:hypothetical protein
MIASFKEITSAKSESGVCCNIVYDEVPECCFKVISGEELTFTMEEIVVLALPMVKLRDDSMLVLDRSWWTPERISASLYDGSLDLSLECASHPTRPVVVNGLVVDVVVIDGCNSDAAFDRYVQHSDVLLSLWQKAVIELGVKPYYGIPGDLKDSWRSVVHITSG